MSDERHTRKSNPGRDIGPFEQAWNQIKYHWNRATRGFRNRMIHYGRIIHESPFGEYIPMLILLLAILIITMVVFTEQ